MGWRVKRERRWHSYMSILGDNTRHLGIKTFALTRNEGCIVACALMTSKAVGIQDSRRSVGSATPLEMHTRHVYHNNTHKIRGARPRPPSAAQHLGTSADPTPPRATATGDLPATMRCTAENKPRAERGTETIRVQMRARHTHTTASTRAAALVACRQHCW